MGQTALRVAQVGKETTFGTAVAATAKLMALMNLSAKPLVTNTQRRYLQGDYAPAHDSIQTDRRGQVAVSGDFTFEDSPLYMLSALKGGVTGTGVGADKTWTFPFPLTADPALESRTWEVYDGTQEYEVPGGLIESFSLSGGTAQDSVVQFEARIIGVDCVKSTLTPALANRVVEKLAGSMCKLYIDALGGTIGSTQKTGTLISWKLDVNTGVHLKKFSDGALTPSDKGNNVPSAVLSATAEFNATSVAEMDARIANTGRLYRVEGLGSLITGAIYKTLRIDIAGDITDTSDLWGDRDGNTTLDFTLSSRLDAGTFAKYAQIVIINALATMPG